MAQYLLAVHNVTGEPMPPEEQFQQAATEIDALGEEMERAGVWVFAGGLRGGNSAATVVRDVNGEIITTDGPFAESKEVLGGFWVIDVADLDAALNWAAKATRACREPIEVRPFWGEDVDPADLYADVQSWGTDG